MKIVLTLNSIQLQGSQRDPSATSTVHHTPQMAIHMTFSDALSGIVRHFYIDPTRFQAVFLTSSYLTAWLDMHRYVVSSIYSMHLL